MVTNIGEILTTTLQASGCFPTTPWLSFSLKNCVGFEAKACLPSGFNIPQPFFLAKALPSCVSSFSRPWKLESICVACDFGKTTEITALQDNEAYSLGGRSMYLHPPSWAPISPNCGSLLASSTPQHTWHITRWVRVLIFSFLLIIINCNLG